MLVFDESSTALETRYEQQRRNSDSNLAVPTSDGRQRTIDEAKSRQAGLHLSKRPVVGSGDHRNLDN
jgi:hypothetical protein